jgi:hypothetical protein
MAQLAVEWLAFKTYHTMKLEGDGKVWGDIIDQAKEMEVEQMRKAFEYGKSLEPFDSFEDFIKSLKQPKKD